jgi:hypothetical protein
MCTTTPSSWPGFKSIPRAVLCPCDCLSSLCLFLPPGCAQLKASFFLTFISHQFLKPVGSPSMTSLSLPGSLFSCLPPPPCSDITSCLDCCYSLPSSSYRSHVVTECSFSRPGWVQSPLLEANHTPPATLPGMPPVCLCLSGCSGTPASSTSVAISRSWTHVAPTRGWREGMSSGPPVPSGSGQLYAFSLASLSLHRWPRPSKQILLQLNNKVPNANLPLFQVPSILSYFLGVSSKESLHSYVSGVLKAA